MRAFMASLVAAFAVLSLLVDNGAASRRVVTGTVTEFQRGEWITVTNETTDPAGMQIALRSPTVYEHRKQDAPLNHETFKSGVRVTVWYRSVGERRPVADKVRVAGDQFPSASLAPRGTLRPRHSVAARGRASGAAREPLGKIRSMRRPFSKEHDLYLRTTFRRRYAFNDASALPRGRTISPPIWFRGTSDTRKVR